MFRLSPHVYLLVVTLCSSTLQGGPVGITGSTGNPAVVIDIVPNNPGPYFGGEQLTFDIWFRSQIVHSVSMKFLQLDFTDTDTNILLDPVFTFDFTSVMVGDHYVVNDSLPIPNAFNSFLGGIYHIPKSRGWWKPARWRDRWHIANNARNLSTGSIK